MSNYSPQIIRAEDLIRRKGQSMTLTKTTKDAYDPINPEDAEETTTTTTSVGVVVPASSSSIRALDHTILDDPVRLQAFRLLYLAAKDLVFPPRPGCRLTTGEGVYDVLGATALNINGQQPILYIVGCSYASL